jgi:hypothetical protein
MVDEYDPYRLQRAEERRNAKLERTKDNLRAKAGKGPSRNQAQGEPITSIAKVESDRGRKNSRLKGNRGELDVAKVFSKWCGELVRRTPGSGGWGGAKEFGTTADLVCSNKAFPFHVECFTGDTLVLTADGYRPISEIEIGDMVMSHTGRWRRVSDKHERVAQVKLLDHGASTESISVTADHPFETFDGGWIPLKEATHTSHLTRFVQHAVSDRRWLPTVNVLPASKVHKTQCDCGCGTKMRKIDAKGRPRRFIAGHNAGPGLRTTLPGRMALDADLCYLLGLYIAEGCCAKDKVIWTFHRDETFLHSAVTSIVESRFSVKTRHQPSKRTKALAVIACSTNLADTFRTWCGTGSRNKRLGWMVGLKDDHAWALIRGLFQGDGHVRGDVAFYNTVSKVLAYDLQSLLFRIGIVSYVGKNARGLYKVNVARSYLSRFGAATALMCRSPEESWRPAFITDSSSHRIYFRDPDLRGGRRAKVYNLSVEHDESYVVQGNIVVHNCKHREGWTLDDLVTGVRKDHDKSIVQWWKQCTETCPSSGALRPGDFSKEPLLLFRRNRQPWLVMMMTRLDSTNHFTVDGWSVSVMLLEEFLEQEPVPKGLKNWRKS